MTTELHIRLRALLAHYDDDALAALANRGLLRRAQKDLAETAVAVLGEDGGRLRVDTGETVVALGDPPGTSTCPCPAPGVCRHILLALLHLRDTDEAPAPAADPRTELLAVTDADLAAYAGAALLRRARGLALRAGAVALVDGPPLVITLPVLNIVCRWVPGSGLDGMLCDCHAPGPCEHRVAAVLAAQAAAGVRALEEDTTALEAATGAPRTRAEVLAAVGDVLAELVGQGVSRAAQALYEELQTLAVSAHGVDLPRLERQLNALADEVRLLRARDAQADTRNLLRAAATVEALRTALAHPTPALVGVHRSRYDPVGRLELLGLGAGRWRTRSGYHGVTAYFWDIGGRQWATWTEARPLTAPGGFDPAARFRDQGPWLGCPSVAQTSGSRVRLTGAWRNGEGRLSGREGIQAVVPGAADPAQGPPPLDDWAQVAEQARRCFRPGLRDADAREALVLLAPARWEAADFDEVRQELTRVIRDAAGRELALWVPYREETAGAVAWLEACRPGGAARVLGTLRLLRGRLVVEPISLHEPPRVTHLTLDPPPKASAFTRLLHAFGGRGSAEDETAATPTGLLLEALLAELEIVAEAGVAARGDTTHLAGLLDDARAIGLASLAAAGTRLLDALARRHRPDAATTLLRAAYLVHLAITAEALLQATG